MCSKKFYTGRSALEGTLKKIFGNRKIIPDADLNLHKGMNSTKMVSMSKYIRKLSSFLRFLKDNLFFASTYSTNSHMLLCSVSHNPKMWWLRSEQTNLSILSAWMPGLLLTSTNRKLSSSTLPLVHKLHGLTCPSMISHVATSVAQSRLRTRSLSAIGKPSLSSRSKMPPTLYEIVLVLNMLWSLLGLGLTWRLELKGSSSLRLLLMPPYLWCSRPQHSFHSRTMRIMTLSQDRHQCVLHRQLHCLLNKSHPEWPWHCGWITVSLYHLWHSRLWMPNLGNWHNSMRMPRTSSLRLLELPMLWARSSLSWMRSSLAWLSVSPQKICWLWIGPTVWRKLQRMRS